jgi:hypothetical protein
LVRHLDINFEFKPKRGKGSMVQASPFRVFRPLHPKADIINSENSKEGQLKPLVL